MGRCGSEMMLPLPYWASIISGAFGIIHKPLESCLIRQAPGALPEFLSMAWRQPTGSAEVGCQTRATSTDFCR
jgi:hypothetical protein